MKNILTTLMLLLVHLAFGQSGTLQGTITDETGDSLMFANITLKKNDVIISKIQTGIKGNYRFDHLESGIYIVEVSYVGYQSTRIIDVKIAETYTQYVNFSILYSFGLQAIPKIKFLPKNNPWNLTQGTTFSADEIQRTPHKN